MQNFRREYKIYIHFEDNERKFSFRIFFLAEDFLRISIFCTSPSLSHTKESWKQKL